MEHTFVNGVIKVVIRASSFERAWELLVATTKHPADFQYLIEDLPNNIDL